MVMSKTMKITMIVLMVAMTIGAVAEEVMWWNALITLWKM
jgi:hypothetical protein